jgi:integrase/recombinase XerD
MKDPSRVQVAGPLRPYARGYADALAAQGYAWDSAVAHLQLLAHLSRWMVGMGLAAGDLRPEQVGVFARARRAAGYHRYRSAAAVRPLLAYLRALGVVPAPGPCTPETPGAELLDRYRRYLAGERGLAPSTLPGYERVARRFLAWAGGPPPAGLTTAAVSRFVLEACARRPAGSAKNVVMALRSWLRFLYVEGRTTVPLAAAVPAVAPWHAAALPRALETEAATRLVHSCDRRTPTGRRDYAILLLLARLGLRAGEVAALELGDLDWRRGELVVRGKGNRQERLPLPVDVGEALADYLRRGAPRGSRDGGRRLFLRVKPPTGGLTGDGVTRVVHAACRRVGLPLVSAHRLRHTVATELLRRGAGLAEVGQVLRHRSLFTTARYAKVDGTTLRDVARPWPGGSA